MNTVVNFVLRMLGFGKAVDALDGETSKAYIGGLGQILTGVATLAGGAAGIASQLLSAHGGGDYLAIAQGLTHNANAGLVLAGAGLISKGVADIGNRHAIAKASASAEAAAPAAAPAPEVKQ